MLINMINILDVILWACKRYSSGQREETIIFALERGTEPRLLCCLSARPRVLASYPGVPLVTSDRACTFPKGMEPISSGAEWQTKAACLPAQASRVFSPETDGRSHLDLKTTHHSASSVTQPQV